MVTSAIRVVHEELAVSWSNQGRLCGGDVPGGEPFEWMVTVTGFHN